jgi:hypothetical protein
VELRAGRPAPATGRRRPDDRHPRRRGAHRRCAVGRGQPERDGPGLRAAVGGLSRERFEDAYYYLLANPPLGLIVQRHGEELRLVTAPRCHPPSNATSTCPVPSHCRRLPWRSWPSWATASDVQAQRCAGLGAPDRPLGDRSSFEARPSTVPLTRSYSAGWSSTINTICW